MPQVRQAVKPKSDPIRNSKLSKRLDVMCASRALRCKKWPRLAHI
jgi:hypothetical protein